MDVFHGQKAILQDMLFIILTDGIALLILRFLLLANRLCLCQVLPQFLVEGFGRVQGLAAEKFLTNKGCHIVINQPSVVEDLWGSIFNWKLPRGQDPIRTIAFPNQVAEGGYIRLQFGE